MNRTPWVVLAFAAMMSAAGAATAEAQVVMEPSEVDIITADAAELDLRGPRLMAGLGLGLFLPAAFGSWVGLMWSTFIPPLFAVTIPFAIGTLALLVVGIRGAIRLVQRKRQSRAMERSATAFLPPDGDPSLVTLASF